MLTCTSSIRAFPSFPNNGYLPPTFTDIELLRDALGDEWAQLALYDNAVDFYAPGP